MVYKELLRMLIVKMKK